MQEITQNIDIFGTKCDATLMKYDASDKAEWKRLWDSWIVLKKGLNLFKAREPNIPEGLTESAFCMHNKNSGRLLKVKKGCNRSFDTYDLHKNKAQQIKATSIMKDLTSFGPKSQWDELFFMDFYRSKGLDGSFDLYKIDVNLFKNKIVNAKKNETFAMQQAAGKRPRISVKEIIEIHSIKPIAKNIKVW